MSSESLHAPRERLSRETLQLHFAITSLMEELDAIDWYRQRADDTDDTELKALLLHNMREEMEHASMLLEWIRRANSDFEGVLKTYLFTEGSILGAEQAAATANPGGANPGGANPGGAGRGKRGLAIGSLKEG